MHVMACNNTLGVSLMWATTRLCQCRLQLPVAGTRSGPPRAAAAAGGSAGRHSAIGGPPAACRPAEPLCGGCSWRRPRRKPARHWQSRVVSQPESRVASSSRVTVTVALASLTLMVLPQLAPWATVGLEAAPPSAWPLPPYRRGPALTQSGRLRRPGRGH